MLDKLITLNIIRGDLTVLRRLLETKADNNLSLTPQDCADFDKFNVIGLLRCAGAFEDDRFRKTLLHVAIAAKNIHPIKLLVEIGCDINSYNNRNESVLHFAVVNEHNDAVILLIEKGVNINEQLPNESALCCAIRIHNGPLTNCLLYHDADIYNENLDGTSPLHYAAKYHNPEITVRILERVEDIHKRDISGPLKSSFESDNFLFRLCCEILLKNAIPHNTYVRASLIGCPRQNLRYLFENELENSVCKYVKTQALLYALKYGDCRTIRFLLDHGAEIGNSKNLTALHYAAENSRDDVVKYFLDHGADVNAKAIIKLTPLHFAVKRGYDQVCKLLLSRGADVNTMSISGRTPLHVAIWYEHITIVKLLLEYGAKVNSKCLSNNVLIRLNRHRKEIIINILIEHVAKLVSLNTWNDEKVLEIIAKNIRGNLYYKNCIEELEKMKIRKVYENVCLFNILIDKSMKSGYARNEDLIEALDNAANQLNHDFPIYYSSLKKDFYKEIEKQRLTKEAAIILNEFFNFHNPFHFANLKILSYLSKEDMIRINKTE